MSVEFSIPVIEVREGYKKLILWKNARELRQQIYQLTSGLPQSEFRRVSQMRDAARSVKQNIQEGYQRGSLGEYIHFLEIAKASLAELQGDVEDCLEDHPGFRSSFQEMHRLCKRTDYLFARLLQSLRQKRSLLQSKR